MDVATTTVARTTAVSPIDKMSVGRVNPDTGPLDVRSHRRSTRFRDGSVAAALLTGDPVSRRPALLFTEPWRQTKTTVVLPFPFRPAAKAGGGKAAASSARPAAAKVRTEGLKCDMVVVLRQLPSCRAMRREAARTPPAASFASSLAQMDENIRGCRSCDRGSQHSMSPGAALDERLTRRRSLQIPVCQPSLLSAEVDGAGPGANDRHAAFCRWIPARNAEQPDAAGRAPFAAAICRSRKRDRPPGPLRRWWPDERRFAVRRRPSGRGGHLLRSPPPRAGTSPRSLQDAAVAAYLRSLSSSRSRPEDFGFEQNDPPDHRLAVHR